MSGAVSTASLVRRGVLVAVAYFATARLGLMIPYIGTQITLLWLPVGIAMAAFFRWGPWMAPAVYAAAVLVDLTSPLPPWIGFGIGIGSTAGPWLTAWLLRRAGFDHRMTRHTDIVQFLGAAALGTVVTATNGVVQLALAHAMGDASATAAWLVWWIGDSVGMVLAGVPLLTLSRAALHPPSRRGVALFEMLALLIGVLVISLAAFVRQRPMDGALMFPLLSVPFVLMSMLALRHGIFPSSIAVLVLSMLAVAGTSLGLGPFANHPSSTGLLALWGYVVALACTTMLLCALASELASSQKRLLALFSNAYEGLLMVDEHGRVAQANRAAAVLLGADTMVLRGLPLWHFEAGARAESDSVLLRLVRRVDAPAPAPVHAGRLRRVDGREFDGECHVATYVDGNGLTQAHVVVRDVTARLRAEADRLAAEAALRAHRAKTEFLSRMSHELRTPLNAVLGFAQLLERDASRMSIDQRGNIGHILHAGGHLLQLIDEVLDLSRIEEGGIELQLVPVPLAALLEEALAVVGPAASQRGVALQAPSESGAALPGVLADAMRLRQVLVNLLDNAVKYTAPGGRVWLKCLPGNDVGGRPAVVIEVGDTGQGLDAAQMDHLFEPFNRLGAERSGIDGTGIGLVISRRFVELMNGHMQVESEPGVGSVFRVVLAAADGAGVAGDVSGDVTGDVAQAPFVARAGRRRVLYVEDNEVNLMLVEAILKPRPELGFVAAGTGEAGLASARGEPPELVLIDMQLPDMSGMEFYRLLRREPGMRDVPCVALSADAMPESIALALAEGFADYLTKPLKLDRFNACLDLHLRP